MTDTVDTPPGDTRGQLDPAAAVGGFSLDVMRRTSDADAPNGLTDFVILETLAWMGAKDLRGLGLDFATMRGTDTAVSSPREGLAMARVESVTEIPVLGKLLAHKGPDPAAAPAPDLERTPR